MSTALPPTPTNANPNERFFRYFQHEITALQQQMHKLEDTALAGGERADATDHCLAGIARLREEVKDAAVYVPAHDQRAYSEAVKGLSEELQDIRAEFAPKPRFAFKTARKNPSAISLSDAAALASEQRLHMPGYDSSVGSSVAPTPNDGAHTPNEETTQPEPASSAGPSASPSAPQDMPSINVEHPQTPPSNSQKSARQPNIRQPSFSQSTKVFIANESSLHIILPPSAARATTTAGTLSSLRKCVVDMSIPTTTTATTAHPSNDADADTMSTPPVAPFASLTLKNITSSLIIAGTVAGPLHATSLSNTLLVASTRQFRMHDSTNCVVYLRCSSRPIIDNCTGIAFAPLPDAYAGAASAGHSAMWDHVDDFKWPKAGHSPNWRTLPEEERVPDNVWRDVVPGDPGSGVDDILRAVGVPM